MSNAGKVKLPEYTYILFKEVGSYTNAQGEEAPVLEPVRELSGYQAFHQQNSILKQGETSPYVIKVTRPEVSQFENFADILQRRKDLAILRNLVHYGNSGQVFDADEFVPLECQLRFKWEFLLENYRAILSEDEKENNARLILMGLLREYSTGNQNLFIQEYLDKVADGFQRELKEAAGYLRLFEEQGFIEITDFFTIRPKKSREFYDSHFETTLKSGRW